MEKFKAIPNYPDYGISPSGHIISLKRNQINELKASKTTNGYNMVYLMNGQNNRSFGVHQLVAMTYLGHDLTDRTIVVDHIDGDKTNNHISNLQVISQKKNLKKGKPQPKTRNTKQRDLPKYITHSKSRKNPLNVNVNGTYLGLYSTIKEATEAVFTYQMQKIENIVFDQLAKNTMFAKC